MSINRNISLQEALLGALEGQEDKLLDRMVSSIQKAMECDMCTLWSINYYEMHASEVNDKFSFTSLLCRKMADDLIYPYLVENGKINDADFFQTFDGCFIQKVFNLIRRSNLSYYECRIDDCRIHQSYNALKKLGLNYFICIPIEKDEKFIAFIKLAYKICPNLEEEHIEELSNIISLGITSALSKYISYKKQQLLNDLILNYRKNDNFDIKKVLESVLRSIFIKFFDYEGASLFIWDSFSNRFDLMATTGLEIQEANSVYYTAGEGLTGKVAKEKRPGIYNDLLEMEAVKDKDYIDKYRDKTKHPGLTMLCSPILRPSDSSVIGIIRFTNKVNSCSKNLYNENLISDYVIDFFNVADIELIDNALHYVSLIIDNYLAEEERKDFISKMSHEMRTPANAIRVTAARILKKMGDERFMRWQCRNYLQSIIDYAQLQIMQSSTNLFLSKPRRNYNIGIYSIKRIVEDSISIVRPIARDHYLQCNNIKIKDDFPESFYKIDYSAFRIIFYNMLTNAIKYVDPNDAFFVCFSAFETAEKLIIQVSDYGIGIDSKEIDNIFLLGYRGKNAMRSSNEGYGIGLHVIKQIVTDFDGSITVRNYKKPTIIEIRLPIKLRSTSFK